MTLRNFIQLAVGGALLGGLTSGCGAGGSSLTPSTSSLSSVSTRNSNAAAAYGPNYVSSLQGLGRWSSFPLTVAFPQTGDYTPERQQIATTGFQEWVTATNSTFSFNVVGDSSSANVTVHFDRAQHNSVTNLQWYPSTGQIVSADITLGTADPADASKSLQPIDLQGAAAHEFGHALGIQGHSPYQADLMYAIRIADVNASAAIGERDLNTIRYDYGTLFPIAGSRAQGPLVVTTIVD